MSREFYVGLQAVQVEIHERKTPRPRYEVLSEVRAVLDALGKFPVDGPALYLFNKPLVRGDKKAAAAAGRVADRELFMDARVRFYAAND